MRGNENRIWVQRLAAPFLGLALLIGSACQTTDRVLTPRVHFHGDSIVLWGESSGDSSTGSFPQLVARSNPHWEVSSGAVNGEGTRVGLRRFRSFVVHRPCLRDASCFVFILEGINDPLPRHDGCDAPPAGTAGRLLEMARIARSAGWKPVLVTLTPAPDRRRPGDGGGSAICDPGYWENWAGRVNAELRAAAASEGVALADLRALWTLDEWTGLNGNDVHPIAMQTRTRIAKFLTRWVKDDLRGGTLVGEDP